MPVTISPLPIIAFSKNPVNLEITSDDYIDVAGVNAVANIKFLGAIAAGVQIPLVWANANLLLEAADAPDGSGLQFPAGDGSEAHVRAVMAVLIQNYYIETDFVLSYALTDGSPSIIFTAINPGDIYNITAQTAGAFSVNQVTTGINLTYKANFAHHLEVWIKQNGIFIQAYNQNLQLDYPVTGVTTKDISEVLNAYLAENTDKPDTATTTWQACGNSLLEYYVKYAQYYDDQPTVKKMQKTASAFVNFGGLAVNAALTQTLTGYLRPGDADNKALCLRQGSKVKAVQPDQPEFLYWLNLTGASADIKLRYELFYVGGGSAVYTLSPQTVAAYQKYYISVGYNQLNINHALPAGKLCLYYTASVVSTGGIFLSAIYTFYPDFNRQYPRYFIYRNSLGGWQTLYTWGKGQPETGRTKTDINKQVTYAQAGTSGRIYENSIRIQQKITVNTGYTSKRDMQLLNDLLASDEKYLVNQGRLIPVGISTDTVQYPMDGNNLNGAAIEFYPLYDEILFTDDVTQPDNAIAGSGGSVASGFNLIQDDNNNAGNDFYTDL